MQRSLFNHRRKSPKGETERFEKEKCSRNLGLRVSGMESESYRYSQKCKR